MYFQPDMVAAVGLPRWTTEPSAPFCAEEWPARFSGPAVGMPSGW
jgi:hypothetical protein